MKSMSVKSDNNLMKQDLPKKKTILEHNKNNFHAPFSLSIESIIEDDRMMLICSSMFTT